MKHTRSSTFLADQHLDMPISHLNDVAESVEKETILTLYDECHDELVQFISGSIQPPLSANDIVQESFLRLVRHPNLQDIDNLKAYLFRIALNLSVDYQRQHLTSTKALQRFGSQERHRVETRTAETMLLAKEELVRLHQALTELSPLCQRIFYLNRFKGFKHRAIAEQLHISVRTVEDNVKRALLHAHRRLGQM
ncbi:MAG: DNA-directed RNA polymerase sigma-70 factor [Nitrospirales bacterium]|nr:MAG: DNA-directed RNA polymerase sigma-70 factor [Nitrospirales bacterium]